MPDRKRKSSSMTKAQPATFPVTQLSNQGMLFQLYGTPFTQEEDTILQALVKKLGTDSWKDIALQMPLHSARQCKERYLMHLCPNLSKIQWTPDDDKQLRILVKQFGEKWDLIANMLQKSAGSCKNRWSTIKKKIDIFEPSFSRKRPPSRVPTMFGMIHNKRQGPHTFPFGLWHAASQNMSFDTLLSIVPTTKQFQVACKNEKIILESQEIDSYLQLYHQFLIAGKSNQAQTIPSDFSFPGNLTSIGYVEASTRMINMSPYATYGWRSGLNLSSKEGHKAICSKGTELAAVNAYEKGELTQDMIVNSIDGQNSKDYLHPEQYQNLMNQMGGAVLPQWDPELS